LFTCWKCNIKQQIFRCIIIGCLDWWIWSEGQDLNCKLRNISDTSWAVACDKLKIKPIKRIVEVERGTIERWVLFQLKLKWNVVYPLNKIEFDSTVVGVWIIYIEPAALIRYEFNCLRFYESTLRIWETCSHTVATLLMQGVSWDLILWLILCK